MLKAVIAFPAESVVVIRTTDGVSGIGKTDSVDLVVASKITEAGAKDSGIKAVLDLVATEPAAFVTVSGIIEGTTTPVSISGKHFCPGKH